MWSYITNGVWMLYKFSCYNKWKKDELGKEAIKEILSQRKKMGQTLTNDQYP